MPIRKKAVHTITHELRSPLTAITGYAGLMRKDCNTDKTGTYIRNIQESFDRMREMLNTLLNFFRLDNGKEQPDLSPCRISAITHILETEFTPIAMNKGLAFTITNQTDTIVLTDKECCCKWQQPAVKRHQVHGERWRFYDNRLR